MSYVFDFVDVKSTKVKKTKPQVVYSVYVQNYAQKCQKGKVFV